MNLFCLDGCNIFFLNLHVQFSVPSLLPDMDDDKPQWEWLIVPKILFKDGSFGSLRLFRIDHGYMDGKQFKHYKLNIFCQQKYLYFDTG